MTNDRKTILARRARFVTAALTSAGLGALAAQGCGGETNDPPGGDASADSAADSPAPCLSMPLDAATETEPGPCLTAPFDASDDAPPQPCLSPPPDSD